MAERIDRVLLETREVRVLPIRADAYLAKVAVADAQVAEFYEKNRKDFETPENVKVEYLLLSADAIAGASPVAEADVMAYYEQNKGRYGSRGAAAREPHPDHARRRRQGGGTQEGRGHPGCAQGRTG